MHRLSFSMASALSLAALCLAIGCGPEATTPSDVGPISLLVVSGNAQSGVVGTELPQPLVIKATKSNGAAIVDLTVNFRVTSGGGSMYAGVASTDSKGIAQDYWTLGTSTAQVQRVEIRAVLSTGQKQVFGVFTATALPGPATQITLNAGDNQTATVGMAVATPPSVLVLDQFNNPVSGVAGTFAVATGGGSLTDGSQTTNAAGIAMVGSWTLGPTAGPNTLTASSIGLSGSPVTFTATGTPACATATQGLVSWWPGEENANDIADGNNGTLQGGATFAAGLVGQAFSFDGVGDLVEIPDAPNLNLTTSLSIDAWIRPSTVIGNHRIVGKGNWSSVPLENFILVLVGDRLQFDLADPAGGATAINATQTIAPGVWTHVAATFDGATMLMFINGVQDPSSGSHATIRTGTSRAWIGVSPDSPGFEPFAGLIDEVDIYNRALSVSEIQSIVNAGSIGKCQP